MSIFTEPVVVSYVSIGGTKGHKTQRFRSYAAAQSWIEANRLSVSPFAIETVSEHESNPPLSILSNPKGAPHRVAVLSNQALELAYVHKEDKKAYKHDFSRGVTVELWSDNTVRLFRKDGRPLFQDF